MCSKAKESDLKRSSRRFSRMLDCSSLNALKEDNLPHIRHQLLRGCYTEQYIHFTILIIPTQLRTPFCLLRYSSGAALKTSSAFACSGLPLKSHSACLLRYSKLLWWKEEQVDRILRQRGLSKLSLDTKCSVYQGLDQRYAEGDGGNESQCKLNNEKVWIVVYRLSTRLNTR